MKLIRYIFLTLLLPVFPAGAQNLCGSRVQVANPSILIGDNGRVMIGMDVTLPADMQLFQPCGYTYSGVEDSGQQL